MIYALREFFYYFKRLISNYKGKERAVMASTYTGLFFKYIFFVKLLRFKILKAKFLGFKVNFFEFYTFYGLFEEIFLTKQYYFESKEAAPKILDCGSNMGMSVLYFKYLYKNAIVTAFEPDPETFSLLKENIEINGMKNVTIVNAALYDSEKTIDFFIPDKNKGSLQMSISENRISKGNKVPVKTVMLSSYINEKINFLKMDIEGAEDAVMNEITASKKINEIEEMVIEIHHNIDMNKEITSVILDQAVKAGFKYQISTGILPVFKKNTFQDILVYAYRNTKQ